MKYRSIWTDFTNNEKYSKLNKDIKVDVLIIGGGITGISTLYHLLDSNLNVCLVERNKIVGGVSSKTTGKLTYLQDNIYTKLTSKYSFLVAKAYLESQKYAISLVENIINQNDIECDFVKQKSYLFANNEKEVNKIKKEKEILERMNVNIIENNDSNYLIGVDDTAYFHPVKYLMELAKICTSKGKLIYENTKIVNIKKEENNYICYTDNNKIIAKKVVLACHYPFFLFPFLFPLKGYLERSYLSASKTKDNKNISGINVINPIESFRYYSDNYNNYFIFLNGTHKLSVKYDIRKNFNYLLDKLKDKNLVPEYIWSNTDIITNDYLPYIGYINENLLLATGYNTWGMTNGSLAGYILSELILYGKSKYMNLFNPKRSMPVSNIGGILNDIVCSAKPFIENKIYKNKIFLKDKVLFTKIDGKQVGVYIDSNNNEHIVYNKCPHLKCSLIFNEIEKTWDCPCHSSRFSIDGKCIQGPSCYDISFKKN